MNSLFERYLKILNIPRKNPGYSYLKELLTAHLIKIPFENISKLYYYKTLRLKNIPDFDLYLEGIEKNNLGGTCYSNNNYFNQLLNHLGFNAKLCGADMTAPDVHLVNVVSLEEKEYLADVGYGSPFFDPIPLFHEENFEIKFGNETFIVFPQNELGHSEMKQYCKNKHKHGYVVKPLNRDISEFKYVIADSFRPSATFLNRITAVKFEVQSSISVRDYSLIRMNIKNAEKVILADKNQIFEQIYSNFNIPKSIIRESLNSIHNL